MRKQRSNPKRTASQIRAPIAAAFLGRRQGSNQRAPVKCATQIPEWLCQPCAITREQPSVRIIFGSRGVAAFLFAAGAASDRDRTKAGDRTAAVAICRHRDVKAATGAETGSERIGSSKPPSGTTRRTRLSLLRVSTLWLPISASVTISQLRITKGAVSERGDCGSGLIATSRQCYGSRIGGPPMPKTNGRSSFRLMRLRFLLKLLSRSMSKTALRFRTWRRGSPCKLLRRRRL
jgi:hypothetical protein